MTTPLQPVRFSNLKLMGISPAHYAYALSVERPETKALRFGSALDALLFQTKPVLVYEGATRRGKAWELFKSEASPDAIILTAPEQPTIQGMFTALQANKPAMDLLQGDQQMTVEWAMNGRACRGTPDAFTRKRVVDLKSTRSANPDFFRFDARKLAYHVQLSWYANGLVTAGLVDPNPACYLVAVESSPPYPVTIFGGDDDATKAAILQGEKLWRLWFERLLVCEASNTWPAYTEAAVPLDMPDDSSLTLMIDGEEVDV